MSALTADDFVVFHREVHGYPPFPWQQRLMADVLSKRAFPALVDVPTGAGKTTLMDIALFALAADAANPPEERWMPRRIFLVVDRRIIVDQAGDRALRLARRLEQALTSADQSTMVYRVASALLRLRGEDAASTAIRSDVDAHAPLTAAILRGGTLRDDGWAHRPDQAVLGASTVDQVGSRLLFQGYGVSPGMASVHAGLMGRDTLYLLDEVHLAAPFRDTLRQLERYQQPPWCEVPVGIPNQVVELSATPGTKAVPGERFGLADADREHPLLQQRLGTSKPARLVETRTGTPANLVATVAAEARRLAESHRTVGVVVNRVASARDIYHDLQKDAARHGRAVHLLTGRMRPLDRQDLLDTIGPRIAAGRERSESDPRLILVATQCIEAGADLDLDALVTECASFDALKQRFGRVDRLGRYRSSESVIVARKTDVTASAAPDPIYGNSLRSTWQWLQELSGDDAPVDFGIAALQELAPPADTLPEPLPAPVLLPAHLDAWAQTQPAPAVQPDISLWLHGPEERARDVQIIWRADISEGELVRWVTTGEDPQEAAARDALRESLLDRLESAPPASPEALSVPISAVRRWLNRAPQDAPELADVEGMRDENEWFRSHMGDRPFLVWAGDRSLIASSSRELRPGQTLIVPATYGGLAAGAWDPVADTPVTDLGDRAQLVARGRVTLRLHAAIYPALAEGLPRPPSAAKAEVSTRAEDAERMRTWLDALAKHPAAEPWLRLTAANLSDILSRRDLGRRGVVWQTLSAREEESPPWWTFSARERLKPHKLRRLRATERARAQRRSAPSDEGDDASDDALQFLVPDFDAVGASSFVNREILLGVHLRAVAARVRRHATHAGLPYDLVKTLRLAARVHDVGKADRRFQLWLHGGDEIDWAAHGKVLAKSVLPGQDRAARRAARERAGYPAGIRHEMASTAMVASSATLLEQCSDPDLLLHLIASHHGWARPFAPPVEDPAPVEIHYGGASAPGEDRDLPELRASSEETLARLDSGVADRFWRANRRYGWHGLAWLEALLRLADHRVSQKESEA